MQWLIRLKIWTASCTYNTRMAGHTVLSVVSLIALCCIDWRIILVSLITFPLSFLCMGLTFKIIGKNFDGYDKSAGLCRKI